MYLFVYGTLIDSKIQRALLGRDLEKTPALLKGFELLHRLPNHYPYKTIKPNKNEDTSGYVLHIQESDLSRLDRYEVVPELYKRYKVKVQINDKHEDAFVYMYSEYQMPQL
jgi:gamma-glutamylcyclotransferase (GGCT)/AIG2-like uncharacterized protein YtfP